MVADKMHGSLRTKWFGQNCIRTKGHWTKWYGQSGTDKMAPIKSVSQLINQSRSHWQCDFFINPASTFTSLGFLCVFITYFWFLVIELTLTIIYSQNGCHLVRNILSVTFSPHHFVRTILFVPFCLLPFCPITRMVTVGSIGLCIFAHFSCIPKCVLLVCSIMLARSTQPFHRQVVLPLRVITRVYV